MNARPHPAGTSDWSSLVDVLRAAYPQALGVWLFGSFASGHADARSDIDLALLLPGKAEPVALWELAQRLASLANRDVDLLDLRAASTVMQYQVVVNGIRLWQADAQAALYESFILSEKTALDEARAGLLQDIGERGRVHG
ncbi:MAG: nucleotidyltransferase domain-containing protein [Pseudoxanthomonas sp.]